MSCLIHLKLRIEVVDRNDWDDLHLDSRYPMSKELRLRNNDLNSQRLTSFLVRCKENVSEGLDVDGIKMLPLKTLIVDFKLVDDILPRLGELVEEVIDLEIYPRFVKIEI